MTESNGNAALYFVDRHRSSPAAGKAAFVEAGEEGRRLSYADLAAQSDRMAALYERHGLRREDRAAVVVLDRIEFPVIFWGSLKAGIVPALLNTLLPAALYDTIFRDSRVRALFVSAELLPAIEPILAGNPYLKAIFVVGGTPGQQGAPFLSFAEELAASEPRPVLPMSPDECAFWLYSSGSTGEPKGVRHVHGSLRATADSYGRQVLGILPDDVVFSAAKMFFAYGLGNSMTFPMSVGATTVLLSARPTPASIGAVMERTEPTVFCGVPTLYAAMLAGFGGRRPAGFSRLRRCISAGEALPADVGARWAGLTGVDILDGVGSTEMLHIFLSNRPGDVALGTSGVAVPGYELRLVDEHGGPVGPGQIGELLVAGASAAESYWNKRAQSRATFQGVWTRTGDKYEQREDGRLIYCGRTDDMFKVSGIWVAPFEVEQALISHPAVLECAVIAARDSDGLEKPKAYVVLASSGHSGGDLAEELKEHVKAKVGAWKYPRWIQLIDELPKTATGKIQRFRLRQMEGTSL